MIGSVAPSRSLSLSISLGALAASNRPNPLAALRDFLESYSIDIAAADATALAARADDLPSGLEVFVTADPEQSLTATVEACVTLRNAGLTPVPHICARNHHRASLDRYLDALASQAGVEAAVVIGGNIERAVTAGVFDSAIEAIATGLFVKHGILRVGVAGYPDGHRLISTTTLRASLGDKLRACQSVGIEPFVVTQFSFDPAHTRGWSEDFLNTHPGVPLAVGLAGPARRATLMRYAARCGVTGALRALTTHHDANARLLQPAAPDRALTMIAALHDEQPGVLRPHFYSFGGFAQTLAWIQAIQAGRIRITPSVDGAGFATI